MRIYMDLLGLELGLYFILLLDEVIEALEACLIQEKGRDRLGCTSHTQEGRKDQIR
jgi:hypothetical protein